MHQSAKFKTEAEMAAHVVTHLLAHNFEVYQEVHASEGCADIVAKAGPLIWAIECKLQLNFDVIAQARRWTRHANFASIAVPYIKSRDDTFACEVLDKFGLGMLVVHEAGAIHNKMIRDWKKTYPDPRDEALERIYAETKFMGERMVGAPYRRKVLPHLKNALHEQQKTFALAGTKSGPRWTPFKNTCVELQKYVRGHPGETIKTVIHEITHHYMSHSSARACLSRLIEEGVIEGVELRREGRDVRLYPVKP